MVDAYGIWYEEKDYDNYPKVYWCDMDYMAVYIKAKGYEPKTSMANLIDMIFAHYDGYLEDNNKMFYTDIDKSENEWHVSIKDIDCFVEDNGGLKEFDYEC